MPQDKQPVTWDETGKMVPLDEEQAHRHRLAAAEIAAGQPTLSDHRMMSHKEFFHARCLELAHGLDAIIKPGEGYIETVVIATGSVLGIILSKLSVMWPVFAVVFGGIASFRLWVRVAIEGKRAL